MNKLIMYVAIAGTTIFGACKGGGIDDATKKELSDFEGNWMKTASDLNNWGGDLQKAMDETKMWMDSCMTGECKKDMKAKCDSIGTSCKGIQDELTAMKGTYDEAKKKADETGKAWGEWKAKVDKGEVKAEEVKKELETYKTGLADLQMNMNKWNSRLGELTAQCKANCGEMKSCCGDKKKDK